QAEDGIRDRNVTGVQTCALPIWVVPGPGVRGDLQPGSQLARHRLDEVRYPTHSSTPASQTLTSDAEASGAVLRAVPVNCRVNTVSSWTPGVSSAVHVAE